MNVAVADSHAEVPGGIVFVRRWAPEAGEGPPLVLLHDSLGCVELWRDFPEALARATAREVVAYDRLGFGRSTGRSGLSCFDFVAEEARVYFPPIRRALGIDRFSLFGHSVGGAMAVVIAALHGDACEAVITEAAQAFVEERTRQGIRDAMADFEDRAQFARLKRWHGDSARRVLDAWSEIWLAEGFRNWNLDDHLKVVSCPVLAIHGDRDEYGSVEFPRCIAGLSAGPSEMVILEGCGHVPHRERKEEVLRLTSSFLERVGGGDIGAAAERSRHG